MSQPAATATPLDASSLSSLAAALTDESNARATPAASSASSTAAAAATDAAEADEDAQDDEDDNSAPVNPLSDDDSSDDEAGSGESDVALGFLDEAIHPKAMLRQYFPCKVGGKAAWLNPANLPTNAQLTCVHCKNPLVFLMQLYAPLRTTFGAHDGSFHRTLFLFCCMDEGCTNKQGSIVCVRSQLPRVNAFYPDVAPPKLDEYPLADGESLPVWEDEPVPGVNLCCVCGNPAPSSCSRCHSRRYCSKLHQLYDWKQGNHKTLCVPKTAAAAAADNDTTTDAAAPPAPAAPASLLFPQQEVVIEPENDDDGDDADASGASSGLTKEQKLLAAYEHQKATDPEEEEDEDEEELASAVSNWSSPKLKDPLFLRFKARIAANPDQVLRYDRASAAASTQPLWVSNWYQPASPPMPDLPKPAAGQKSVPPPRPLAPSAEANDAAIPPCAHCGGRRRFEFQVLPQLLYYLGSNSAVLDFANVVVYTCEQSCGDGGKLYFEEYAWVQAHAQ